MLRDRPPWQLGRLKLKNIDIFIEKAYQKILILRILVDRNLGKSLSNNNAMFEVTN